MSSRVERTGPNRARITSTAGDSWNIPVVAFLGEPIDGNEIDVSDFTYICQIRLSGLSEEAIDINVDTTDAALGILHLMKDGVDTAELEGCWKFGLRAIHSTIGPKTWLTGEWIVERPIAR